MRIKRAKQLLLVASLAVLLYILVGVVTAALFARQIHTDLPRGTAIGRVEEWLVSNHLTYSVDDNPRYDSNVEAMHNSRIRTVIYAIKPRALTGLFVTFDDQIIAYFDVNGKLIEIEERYIGPGL